MLVIAKYPQKILRQKAKSISQFNDDLKKLAEDMAEIMYNDNGIGLAAPQVSQSIRMVVVGQSNRRSYQVYINPQITFKSDDSSISEEGCLSLPGIFGLVKRSKKIHIKYYDLEGKKYSVKIKGVTAIVLQHELDHLDGILFIDRAEKITKGQDILDKLK